MCSCMRTAKDVSDEASSEVEPSDVASFAVGDTFSSCDDLKKKLAEFKKSHSVQLTQRDSRSYGLCEMSNESTCYEICHTAASAQK